MTFSVLHVEQPRWPKMLKDLKPGERGDYQIIDENGQLVWASELQRRYWTETYPRPAMPRRN